MARPHSHGTEVLPFHRGVEDRRENALEVDAAEPGVETHIARARAPTAREHPRMSSSGHLGSVAFLRESGEGGAHLQRRGEAGRDSPSSLSQDSSGEAASSPSLIAFQEETDTNNPSSLSSVHAGSWLLLPGHRRSALQAGSPDGFLGCGAVDRAAARSAVAFRSRRDTGVLLR